MAATAAGDRSPGVMRVMTFVWVMTSVYYFWQYMLRSAPSVMVPQLSEAFGLSAVGVASLIGLFYYGYAPFSLVAGVALDQLGPRKVVPLGAITVAVGALMFATGDQTLGSIGRFLQGAGGVFALIGAVYIATTYMPASRAATLIGATQMFGMAGGSAGQFLVGGIVTNGLPWNRLWLLMGVSGIPLAVLLYFLMPNSKSRAWAGESWWRAAARSIGAVFANPQSLLCGVIAGLLFVPTTIFDMVWGVRFLQEAHDLPYSLAVLRSASVPFGWIIGCPLLGWLSDRLGRRKPVIIGSATVLLGCLALILFGSPGMFPAYSLGLLTGIASGGSMLTYTVIKEANRPEYAGTATGVVNFLNFGITAVLGPLFASKLIAASEGGERELGHYQAAFTPLLYGVALAILLTLLLRETGPKASRHAPLKAATLATP